MGTDTDLELTRKEAGVIVAALHDFYDQTREADPKFWEWMGISHDGVLELASKIHDWAGT